MAELDRTAGRKRNACNSASPHLTTAASWATISHGWAVGSTAWRQAKAEEYGRPAVNRGYRREEVLELRVSEWAAKLAELQKRIGKSPRDAAKDPKGANWKVAVAEVMRRTTTAPHAWTAGICTWGQPVPSVTTSARSARDGGRFQLSGADTFEEASRRTPSRRRCCTPGFGSTACRINAPTWSA
jgi:hypothetical protein